MNIWNEEPVALVEAAKVLVADVVAALIGFGVLDWTPEQVGYAMGALSSLLGVFTLLVVRNQVTPTWKVESYKPEQP
ncbi:MAG: hypothetical protein ACRDH8_13035 [Actinomycetota bacterium]